MPTRDEAWELLCEYTKGDSLRKHALAVETAMRACAKRYGDETADVDEWGLVGLIGLNRFGNRSNHASEVASHFGPELFSRYSRSSHGGTDPSRRR